MRFNKSFTSHSQRVYDTSSQAPRPDAHVTLPPAVGNPGTLRAGCFFFMSWGTRDEILAVPTPVSGSRK